MKKERYFTDETVRQGAQQLVQALGAQPSRSSSEFRPADSALLVLDMQAYFLDPASHAYVPSAEAILPAVIELAQAYAQKDLPLIFTRHINTLQDGGAMLRWWRDSIASQSPLSQIVPQLPVSRGILLPKSQYDAFYNTRLAKLLEQASVSQVVICGVMTHLCCETTARSAFVHGFDVFFPVDGTATYNLQFHQASLLNLSHGFATITTLEYLLRKVALSDG